MSMMDKPLRVNINLRGDGLSDVEQRDEGRRRHLSFLLSSITDPGVKDDDELANFPKLPVDALESDR